MRNSALSMWKSKGLKEILANGEGFWFFIFDDPDCCKMVLEGGPWYVGGFNLILKQWSRMMKLTKEKATKVPVWVRLFNVPMECWDSDGLSRIASAVGVPLFMDNLTEKGSRVSFARVCVEIDAACTLPAMFNVSCGGDTIVVKVEYQGLPAKCDHCVAFGHATTRCVKSQVEKLVNLQKETEENPDPGWSTVTAKGKRKVGDPEGIEHGVQNEEVDGQLGADTETIPEGVEAHNTQVLEEKSHREGTSSDSSKVEPSPGGEVNSPNTTALENFQKDLVEITRLALPNETELTTKVESLVEATQAMKSPIQKQISRNRLQKVTPLARAAKARGKSKEVSMIPLDIRK
ncbi:uncharacterized protein LOC114283918 [Camellia sinensis]|uniref:uncharacterized protein LOC114283918 n=1 Tax=Camellia sinensis TaxID=4442 RepID=UPI001035F24F|nr:uncharacterized protein LOC114283918 [Camellia sinensis]